jgi:hypothetical protein
LHLGNQAKVTSRRQALDAGWSPKAIEWRLHSGRWRRLRRGSYAAFTGDASRKARLWAAVLRAGAGAVLSHETAAEVHGFASGISESIHISVPAERNPARLRPIRGVVIHRARGLTPGWQPPWELPRTTVEDTVLDLITAASTFDEAYGWISAAVGEDCSTVAALRQALAGRSRIRWRAWLTEALGDSADGVNSPLERRYARDVERAHGLPKATRQARRRVGSGAIYLDNLYEGYQLCVELDGAAAHPAKGRWRDAARDNANIAADNTRTIRFGWVAVTELRCQSAQLVANSLRNSGWQGVPRPCAGGCSVT